jgi:hypothetical protein
MFEYNLHNDEIKRPSFRMHRIERGMIDLKKWISKTAVF